MDKSELMPDRNKREGEQGGALLICLLIATVLLVAGGALIQVTSMSATNTFDATVETETYYAAEAGLQSALNALRGNAAPSASAMPADMTRITFRNAVDPARRFLNRCASLALASLLQPANGRHARDGRN